MHSFGSDFRKFFFKGLAAVLPTVLTIALIAWVFANIQNYCGQYVNAYARKGVIYFWNWVKGNIGNPEGDYAALQITKFWNEYLFWFGFLLALVGIYILGRFFTSFLGKTLYRFAEKGLKGVPVINQVYPSIKQVTDFFLAEKKVEYSKVVALEYPRKGIWSIGLVTSDGLEAIVNATGEDLVSVFIPSSPTPVTGYTVTVRRSEVIDLPLTIDEALRFTISGGMIQPGNSRVLAGPAGESVAGELSEAPLDKEAAHEHHS